MPGMLIAVVNIPFPPTFRSFFLLENSSLRLAFLQSQQNRVMSFPMLLLLAMDRARLAVSETSESHLGNFILFVSESLIFVQLLCPVQLCMRTLVSQAVFVKAPATSKHYFALGHYCSV